MKEKNQFERVIMKVGITTIIWNVILSVGKVIAGILAKTTSLISDGIHSASDVISTVIVMIGAKLSAKSPDKEHPYGHERMESIAAIILAMILGGTAVLLGYNGFISIIDFTKGIIPQKTNFIYIALGSAIASIVIKFLMYAYTLIKAKQIKSTSLKADAYHHLSDSLSSIGSVLGIVGIMIGGYWAILDPIACIVIALFILKVAFDIAKEGINQVVDKSASDEFQKQIEAIVAENPDIKNLNSLKTRLFGNKLYLEISIEVDENLTVREGHNIAQALHNKIEDSFESVKHCMIHVDPDNQTDA